MAISEIFEFSDVTAREGISQPSCGKPRGLRKSAKNVSCIRGATLASAFSVDPRVYTAWGKSVALGEARRLRLSLTARHHVFVAGLALGQVAFAASIHRVDSTNVNCPCGC